MAPRQLILRACHGEPGVLRVGDREDQQRFHRHAYSDSDQYHTGGRHVRRQRVCVMRYAPLADVNRQILQLAHRAANLAHEVRKLQTNDVGYFGRVAAHLNDFASVVRSTTLPTGDR
jgi:hypothetical protein